MAIPGDCPVNIRLPEIKGAADLPKISAALLLAVSPGSIGPTEAVTLAKLVEPHRNALGLADIEESLQKLEAMTGGTEPIDLVQQSGTIYCLLYE